MSVMSVRRRVYEILEVAHEGDRTSRVVDLFIMVLIGLNVAAIIAETVSPIYNAAPGFFRGFEIFSVGVFTIEYLLRVWSCTADPATKGAGLKRLKFVLTPLALVDLLAILPFYIAMLGFDLRVLRALRLFRIFRVAKLGRYSEVFATFGRVLHRKKEELLSITVIIFILLIVSSSLIYFAEIGAQPEQFSSIPASMWWGIVTLTTIGYGDLAPVTGLGRLLAAFIAVLGLGLFALPTSIIGSGFIEEIHEKNKLLDCPHCGKWISLGP